ncbi:hypothetical protein CR513_16229, partial [Mucuna pruriens]
MGTKSSHSTKVQQQLLMTWRSSLSFSYLMPVKMTKNKFIKLRYQKFEKATLVIVVTARKLRPYFQSHPVKCRTNLSIKQILRKLDLVGRMVGWMVELSKFDMAYETKGHLKAQVLAGFVNELTPKLQCLLTKRYSFISGFRASNNQAEYEALLAGIQLAKDLGARMLTVSWYGEGTYRDLRGVYLHVSREKKERADLLAKLGSTQKGDLHRIVIQEALGHPTIEETRFWKIHRKHEELKERRLNTSSLRASYLGKAFLFLCYDTKAECAIKEVNEGACGSHISGRALASKIARAGFYWPIIKKDSLAFVKKYDKCQCYTDRHQALPEQLHSGVDIFGPFPLALGQVKFLLVVVDYFTMSIEVELVATISTKRVRRLYWRRIIYHFGLSPL